VACDTDIYDFNTASRSFQKLLWAFDQELASVDMAINVKKSCCLRIAASRGEICSSGREFVWVSDIRYLGVCVPSDSTVLSTKAKQSFYRTANDMFAKVGRLASGEVMVQLLKQTAY